MPLRALWLFIALSISVPGWAGASGIRMPEPVTANVADDFDPSLSADGGYMAFVSNRGKNADIWLKVLGEKKIETWLKILRGKDTQSWLKVIKSGKLFPTTLFRITTDTSSDTSPALSPDGRKLAFVSTRSDPKGDIYLLDLSTLPLKNPRPVRLTGIDTANNDPVFSPDAKKIFYTSAMSATHRENIWYYNIANKTKHQLTTGGGFSPAISADGKYMVYVVREKGGVGGDLAVMRLSDKKTAALTQNPLVEGFPAWDGDGGSVYFVRYREDTDKDGEITLQDRSDLYSVPFSPDIFEGIPPPTPKQLTSSDTYDLFPSVAGNKIYFSSSRPGRDQEIYEMDKSGIITYQEGIVGKIQQKYPSQIYLPLLALANFIQDASAETPTKLLARAVFDRAVLYQESIGDLRAAQDEFQTLIKKYPGISAYPALAHIRLARIEVELARAQDRRKAPELIRRKISELDKLARNKTLSVKTRDHAHLAIGDFQGMIQNMLAALESYKRVTSPGLAARALYHTAGIYRIFNQDLVKVHKTYLKIITTYPHDGNWADRAAAEIINTYYGNSTEETIANLRQLQNRYPDIRAVVAKAKNKIGSLYEEAGKTDQAKGEYAGVIQSFADQKNEIDRARFSLARIYYNMHDFENCLEVYREIEQNTSEREEVYRSARRNFIRRSLEKAKREFFEGEPRLAIKSFLHLIEYDDSILEAHRGVLRVYASLNEIDRVTQRFIKRAQAEPGNYIPHYVLGLALTYQDPPDLDGAESNIKRSLALQFRNPYPHQTLGWIYEQREQVLKEGNFFEKALAEYQIALSLNDENPLNQANLYANIGNCYFYLKSYHLAYDAYQKRGVYPHDDLTSESIFYQRYADTAFRTGKSDMAVQYYQRAMKNALKSDDTNRLALLYDKLGLASQDTGDYKAAAAYFSKSLQYNRKLENFSNITLALRNIAYNFYYLAQKEDREKNLHSALDYYQQSLESLYSYGGKRKEKNKALFKIELEVGGDGSGSSGGFDTRGEEKLITTYMGRIFKEAGNNQKALDFLEKKISLLPGNWKENVSLASERSVVLNQAGVLASTLGDDPKALDYFIKSFSLAKRLKNKTGMITNAINVAHTVLASAGDGVRWVPQAHEMISAAQDITKPRDSLQRIALNNASALLWYNSPAYPLVTDTDTQKTEAALWELKREALPSAMLRKSLDLIGNIPGQKALTAIRAVLLANLAQVSSNSKESAEYRRQALDIARQNTLKNLQWRLISQEGLIADNFSLLAEATEVLESIPAKEYKKYPHDSERMEDLYGAMVRHLAEEKKFEEAFYLSERFRNQVYLRTLKQGGVLSVPVRVEIEQIQEYLEPTDILVKYEQIKGKTLWWRVDKNSFSGASIENAATEKLLAPISLEGVQRIYLILPPVLQAVLWEAISVDDKPLIEQAAVVRLDGTDHFNKSYQARNLAPLKIFWAGSEDKVDTADTFSASGVWTKEGDFLTQAARWSLLHLNLPLEETSHPASWVLPSPLDIGNRISPYDFALVKSRKQLAVFFPESPQSAARTAHDLSASGFPTTLAYHGPDKIKDRFFKIFYKHLSQNTPAEALRFTLSDIKEQGPADWACASLYGFGGMNEDEQKQFAKSRLSKNLKYGITAYRAREWETAIGHLEEGLSMMTVLNMVKNTDKVYQALVSSFYALKNYRACINYQKKLIAFYQAQKDPDWEVVADARHHLGVLFSRVEEFDLAADELSGALKIYREYEITDKIARGYGTLGIVQESASDYQDALKHFQAALKENKEQENIQGVGKQLRRLGRIYYLRLNDYERAESTFKEARDLFSKTQNKAELAETVLEQGMVRERMADFPGAIAYYKEGYDLAKNLGDKLLLSKAAVNMANTAWFQGDYQTAFTRQQEAQELAIKAKDIRGQQIAENLAGLIYWTLNDYEKALKHLHRALELAHTMKSKIDIASAYNNIGLVHREKKDYLPALENFHIAWEIDKSIGSRWGEGYDLRNMGIVYLRRKEYDLARKNLEAAVRISTEIQNRTNQVKALLELGGLTLETGDYPASHRYLEDTVRLSGELVIPEVHWRALLSLGELAEAEGEPDVALDNYSQAIQVVEQMRASIKVEEFKNGFLTNKTDLYDKMILLLISQGKTEEAYNMSERSRARSFIDILGNRKITLKDNVSEVLIERRKLLKGRIMLAEKRLSASRENKEKLKKDLLDLRHRYEELLIQIKQQNPQLSSFVTVDPLTSKDVRLILDQDTALLEYHITENKILVWVVKHDSITVREIEFERDSLKRAVLDYRSLLQDLEAHRKPSQSLYELLIKPVEEDIEGVKTIGVVPHGPLHYLAFASLWDGRSYLVEKYPLFYVPSASVLKFVSAEKREPTERAWVLAVGNPDLGSFNYDLPLAEMEVQSMKWNFPKVDILMRDKATESWVVKNIGRYNIIHFATHGEFDSVNPLFSALKLTAEDDYDGNLEVNEVFSLDLKADLVTLSACQTGLGKVSAGDEIIGLNRAFLYAGTRSILSTLWRVSDLSTAVLIKHFYRNYSHLSKAESLQKAQILVMRYFSHPSYWAGLSLTGDYR